MFYRDLNTYLKDEFGEKVYKIALSGGMTCPNRDGSKGDKGCIFCSAGGSGEFAPAADKSIKDQLAEAKAKLSDKYTGHKYIAYFQSYTNTYAPTTYLKKIFTQAISDPEVVALSIGTRPDCISDDTLQLLKELNKCKPVWIELGLQTVHEETAKWMRRGYELPCFEQCVAKLKQADIKIIVHVILGLPNETKASMIETVEYLNKQHIDGIKLQLLHVLEGTDLAELCKNGQLPTLTIEEYIDILADCVEHLSPEVVVHRLTGDGPKKILIAPQWSADKKRVWNTIQQEFARRNVCQGRLAGKEAERE